MSSSTNSNKEIIFTRTHLWLGRVVKIDSELLFELAAGAMVITTHVLSLSLSVRHTLTYYAQT